VGLGGLGLAILAAPAVSAAGTPTCDWTDTNSSVTVTAAQGQSPPPVLQAAVGDHITVSCSNLAATLAVVFSSPLAGVVQPTAAQVTAGENPAAAMTTIAALDLGFAGGAYALPNGTIVNPITITAGNLGSDPNATCPPTQAQVDAGLTNCALAVATAAAAQESVVLVNYSAGATNPTPTAPSLAITNGSHGFVGGNTVNVADGPSGKWWSTLTTGAPNAGLGIPNPAVVIDAASATPRPAASAVTIAPATYVNGNCHGSPIANCGGVGGTLTPPVLGGSFTWPGSPELSAGSHTVTLFALDLAPAGTVGSTLGSPCPPSPVPCVNASALANEQAASALVGGSFSPASGVGSAGNTLQFDVSPVDAQGSVLCEARFTNGATVNPYAGTNPERPTFGFGGYAGWFTRVGASLIDGLVASVALIPALAGVVVLAANTTTTTNPDGTTTSSYSGSLGLPVLLILIGGVAYLAFFVWNVCIRQGRTGATLGKSVLAIRLVNSDGQPIGPGWAFLRYLLHTLDGFCYLGYLWPIWDSRKQTFADKIMNTFVIQATTPQERPFR